LKLGFNFQNTKKIEGQIIIFEKNRGVNLQLFGNLLDLKILKNLRAKM